MRPRKKYGQHFLESAWADKLVAAIEPRPDDRFLEIGPGPGALTLRLSARAAHVTAVEVDAEMVAALAARVPANVDLIQDDFLEFSAGDLLRAGPLRVAGNLPYNVSSPILFKLIALHRAAGDSGGRLIDATLMLQREVADRLLAPPGTKAYGVISIFAKRVARLERLLSLPPGAFRPPPQVHSAVLRLTFQPPSPPVRDEAVFEAMVRSMFTQRRKVLANALASFAGEHGIPAAAAIEAAGLDPRRRPETLQLEEIARLADIFSPGRT